MVIDEPIVINLADASAIGAPRGATFIRLEPEGVTWPDTGVNVQVMQPGEPNGRYHSEPVQEDFLVLYGECIAIVEDEERTLRQWDFLHCPAGTEHIFVGAGDGLCAVLMIGSRREDACHYTVNETAARYDASVSKETDDPAEAYADWRAAGGSIAMAATKRVTCVHSRNRSRAASRRPKNCSRNSTASGMARWIRFSKSMLTELSARHCRA